MALLLILLFLTGCAAPTAPEENTYTDALSREIVLPDKPQRVAALLGSFADIWCLAGGSLCAAPEDAWEDFGLNLPQAVHIGGAHSPNTELLIASQPDLVLASASTAADVQLLPVLEGAGIPVVYFDVDCFADYLHMLEVCTGLTGRKDLYQQNGLALENRINALKAQLADAKLPDRERSVLLLRVSSGSVKAKSSSGTILGQMLEELGCQNIADSDRTLLETFSTEAVLRQDPYRIFVVTMGDDTQQAIQNLKSMLEENPAWGSLTALKENRLHFMDKQLFNLKPNGRWAEAYETLADILIPKS